MVDVGAPYMGFVRMILSSTFQLSKQTHRDYIFSLVMDCKVLK